MKTSLIINLSYYYNKFFFLWCGVCDGCSVYVIGVRGVCVRGGWVWCVMDVWWVCVMDVWWVCVVMSDAKLAGIPLVNNNSPKIS
jgi:hypothetical protein